MSRTVYRVLYTDKAQLKRRVYHDGELVVIGDTARLHNDNGECVTQLPNAITKSKLIGRLPPFEVAFGTYCIEVEAVACESDENAMPESTINNIGCGPATTDKITTAKCQTKIDTSSITYATATTVPTKKSFVLPQKHAADEGDPIIHNGSIHHTDAAASFNFTWREPYKYKNIDPYSYTPTGARISDYEHNSASTTSASASANARLSMDAFLDTNASPPSSSTYPVSSSTPTSTPTPTSIATSIAIATSAISTTGSSTGACTSIPIDGFLLRAMRPHQVDAVHFFLNIFLHGAASSTSSSSCGGDSTSASNASIDIHAYSESGSSDDDDDLFAPHPPPIAAPYKRLRRLREETEDANSIISNSSCSSISGSGHTTHISGGVKDKATTSNATTSSTVRGGILADEMGLGKTLTAIAIIWTIIRPNSSITTSTSIRTSTSRVSPQGSKAIIVCPSSLVRNWAKEVRKWLGTRLTPTCVCASNSSTNSTSTNTSTSWAEEVVERFRVQHAAVSPVLIISYEMFRTHAAIIAATDNISLLVCDEGHRLKSSAGTQTIEALRYIFIS